MSRRIKAFSEPIIPMKEISTNEEKAREIATRCKAKGLPYNANYDTALEAMQWKQQQLIGKCKEFCNRQTTGEYYDRRGVFLIDKYIDDMLNFIKGE